MEKNSYKLRVTRYNLSTEAAPFAFGIFPKREKKRKMFFLRRTRSYTELHLCALCVFFVFLAVKDFFATRNTLHVTRYALPFCLLLSAFCLFPLSTPAQDVAAYGSVTYGYDDSGNRISRTINMSAPAYIPPPQDSTENVVDDEEDLVTFGQDMENEEETPQEITNGAAPKTPPQEVYTDALSETLITIYPNPTRGLLTVKISNMPQHAASSLTLFDMQGRVITQQPSLAEENKLDISAQPPGTYIMRIAVGDEDVSWKIVKMSEP